MIWSLVLVTGFTVQCVSQLAMNLYPSSQSQGFGLSIDKVLDKVQSQGLACNIILVHMLRETTAMEKRSRQNLEKFCQHLGLIRPSGIAVWQFLMEYNAVHYTT